MAQLAHHFCSTLNILKPRVRKSLVKKKKKEQEQLDDSVQVATHGPRVKLLLHRHHGKVALACTHVLGTAATFKHVHFLGGVLATTPKVQLP